MTAELVAVRRERVLSAMADAEIDVLVLGRQDNAGYACGMRRLWTAGTRPFGAGCIVVRATGRVHALSSWDAGIEEPMSSDDLYPLTWNPRVMAASMAGIEGLPEAARIGVDEVTPSFRRAAAHFAPSAEVVAADDLMARVRRHKLPAEVEAITRSCEAAWVGVRTALEARREAHAVGAAIEALAKLGVTIPSSGVRFEHRDEGVAVDVGVICDLYEGGVGGRFVGGERTGSSALNDACRPGATQGDLAGAATSDDWLVRGLGMGFERPVIGSRIGFEESIEAQMVLSVTDGARRDVVHVTPNGPTILNPTP